MKKFLLISPKNRTVYNFRGDLIQSIKADGYDVIVTGPNKENIDKIEELCVKFVEIPMNKNGLNPIADIRYLIALNKMIRSEKPDITLGYTIKPVIYGAIAAKIAGVKNINSMITGVGYLFTAQTIKAKILRMLASILYKVGLGAADSIIFQNPDDKKEFIDRKLVNAKKCHIVNGSGVNMTRFTPTPYPKRLSFFMLSRIMNSKGIREYLEAAMIVKQNYPNIRFMLLGAMENIQDSISMDELNKYIDKGIIEYYKETSDIRPIMAKCSVYVLPSYREGTPRTVLEAMAMGKPIITSDAPGCRETVIDGVNGFLVPVKDVRSLVEKMEWFIKNESEIPVMGKKSYEICQQKFEVSKINKSLKEICKLNKNLTISNRSRV